MHWMFLPLKRYADFSGRSRRMEYWMWVVFQFLIALGFVVIAMAVGGAAVMNGDAGGALAAGATILILYLLYMLIGLAFFIPNLAVTVRRLHDTDRSGWWMLLPLGPYLVGTVAAGVGASAGPPSENTLMAVGGVVGIAMLVALVLWIVLIVFLFLGGTRGPNRFGPDPKGQSAGDVFT